MHRGLRGEAARGIRGVAIHAVLRRIDVDGGKIGGAELVERIENLAEFIGFVSREALGGDGVESLKNPAIKQRVF